MAMHLRALGSWASHKHGTCGAGGLHASDQAHPETDLRFVPVLLAWSQPKPRRGPQPITTWGKNRELSLVINESSSRMPIPEALPPTTQDPIRV